MKNWLTNGILVPFQLLSQSRRLFVNFHTTLVRANVLTDVIVKEHVMTKNIIAVHIVCETRCNTANLMELVLQKRWKLGQ